MLLRQGSMTPSVAERHIPSAAPVGASAEASEHASKPAERYGKPLPDNWIPLYDKPSRTPTRRLRVVTIGAGISAMGLAYKLHHEHQLDDILDSVVYEANVDIGGTWLVNRYPGVAWYLNLWRG